MRPTGQVMNIVRTFHAANEDELRGGLTWYRDMGDLVVKRLRSIKKGLSRDAAFGIVAALSPQKNWSTNIKLAEQLVRTGNTGTYKPQVAKALRILNGEKPEDVLTGPKETAFYRCFADPKGTDAVTVDGHALNIWLGAYSSITKVSVTKRLYRLASHDYVEAAEILGVRPLQVQAVTWLAWRRLHGSKGRITDINSGVSEV